MDFKRLRYFVAVADEQHFGRAAERLHMAQPPLSQQIRRLENEIGLELFDRTTRPISLTHAGRTLYADAQPLVVALASIDRKMTELATGGGGLLRLGFVGSASYSIMPAFVRAFSEKWPLVETELIAMSSDEQFEALTRGDIDLGISRVASVDSSVASTMLQRDQLFVAVGGDHRFADRKRLDIASLADEAFIGFRREASPTLFEQLVTLFRNRGITYDPAFEASDYATIVGLVATGRGIAVVPASVRAVNPPNLRYVEIREADATSPYFLLFRSGDLNPMVARAAELVGGAEPLA